MGSPTLYSAVFTVVDETAEELSWPARVSCSLFHLTDHGLPVDSAPLLLCVYRFLFSRSISPSLFFSLSLSLSVSAFAICLYA